MNCVTKILSASVINRTLKQIFNRNLYIFKLCSCFAFQPSTEDTPKEEANILPVIKLMAKSNKLVIRFCIIYFIW